MSDEQKDVVGDIAESTQGAPVQAEAQVENKVKSPAKRVVTEPTGSSPALSVASERTWAALAHASVLLTFALGISTGGLAVVVAVLVPLSIWLVFRDRSRFVAFQAMQATLFQLASLLVWVGLLVAGLVILIPTWIVTILLSIILIGLLLLPLALVLTLAWPASLVALPLACLVYGLYAAFEVYAGRDFRYWLVADWIESRGVKLTA